MKSAKRKLLEQRAQAAQLIRTPAAEQLLVEEIPSIAAARILCTSLGRGQFAQVAANYLPGADVLCHFLDMYLAAQAVEHCGSGERLPQIVCAADFPEGPFDLVAIPVDPRGEAELTRDILQAGHERLTIGGRLLSATSAVDDQWLHGELRKLFEKVTRAPMESGVVYRATKTAPLKKHKNFECEFAFRDQGRLIRAVSRPGVFSHRSLDAGARALINTMTVRPGDRVLDLGCGSGVVALAAAARAENVAVVAVDSHARAVECTKRAAALNQFQNFSAILNAEGDAPGPGTFDLVLGNPPYYSDYRIAEIFLQCARRALKPGGEAMIVAKSYAWFETRMPELFDTVTLHPHKQYMVVVGVQKYVRLSA
jgi:16S rRNA (guanine1207-N2)-methyltransferase